ncbi:MAG TPA: hypothetical protein VFF72_00120 [Caldimonas sp.]|nr:hypothetical protein [Caldimonas sp.]
MTAAELDGLRAVVGSQPHRIRVVETAAGRVVVKQQRPSRSPWRGRALNLLARALGLRLLQAVPAHGGARGQAIEVDRLRRLAQAGVRVPPVLHVEGDFFVVAYLDGRPLVEIIERGGVAGVAAWQRGLAALVDLHRRGGYLSHAFARNFLDSPAGLAMIDFEDDPLEAMTLAEAQARDWLAYLHSTAWLLPRDIARDALARHLASERADVRALVEDAGRRLAMLRHLPRTRRVWGREVVGAQAAASLLSPAPAPAGQ